mgnify:CR=1 FL=1
MFVNDGEPGTEDDCKFKNLVSIEELKSQIVFGTPRIISYFKNNELKCRFGYDNSVVMSLKLLCDFRVCYNARFGSQISISMGKLTPDEASTILTYTKQKTAAWKEYARIKNITMKPHEAIDTSKYNTEYNLETGNKVTFVSDNSVGSMYINMKITFSHDIKIYDIRAATNAAHTMQKRKALLSQGMNTPLKFDSHSAFNTTFGDKEHFNGLVLINMSRIYISSTLVSLKYTPGGMYIKGSGTHSTKNNEFELAACMGESIKLLIGLNFTSDDTDKNATDNGNNFKTITKKNASTTYDLSKVLPTIINKH